MSALNKYYKEAKCAKKQDFDADGITDILLADPLNIDINKILHTPATVVVTLPREEYLNKKVIEAVTHRYNVKPICKADSLIFGT